MRKPARARWRALTLGLVNVLMVLHFVHWRVAGRTMAPAEPSETMVTLEQGVINAGFVFLALAALSTLVLGRWVCGWGCHLIAVQDLCAWLLKKLGLRPKPLRSRALALVPLAAAAYMFAWPSVLRWWYAEPAPALTYQFSTRDFWANLPGPGIAIATLTVCGFAVVYFLGGRGFCRYACPYGGIFGLADRLAVGKIRVTDACDGCGHCTANCTSNVRVHEEVKRFGMVVDSNCMKCTDCIDVCPKDALYFGFGRPTLARGHARAAAPPRRPAYTWVEELALGLMYVVSFLALRGLYDTLPFLLALGLAGVCAGLGLTAIRLLYRPVLDLGHVPLRCAGRLTAAGGGFAAAAVLLAAFIAHSAAVQYHGSVADDLLRRSAAAQDQTSAATLVRASLPHLDWLRTYGLFPTAKTEAQLGGAYLYLDQHAEARVHLERALELAPDYAAARYKYAEWLARQGDLNTAVDHLRAAICDNPALADARRDLIGAARQLGRLPEVVRLVRDVVDRRPHDIGARLDLAALLGETGALAEALTEARRGVRDRPDLAETHFRLGVLLADSGDVSGALDACERAVQLDPDGVSRRYALGCLAARAGRSAQAVAELSEAQRLAPLDPAVARAWAAAVVQADQAADEIARATAAPPDDVNAAYRSLFLYAATGNTAAAQAAWARVHRARPDLPPP